MKKLLLSIGCMVGLVSAASAAEYVISTVDMTGFTKTTYTYDGKEKGQIAGVWTAEDGTAFNVVMKQQASNTAPDGILGQSSQCRWYKDFEMTITAPESAGVMTQIVFTVADSKHAAFAVEGDKGTVTDNTSDITWTYAEGMNPFVATANSAQIRFNKVVITTGEGGGETPVDPTPGPGEDPDPVDPTPGDATVVSFNVNDATDIVGTYTPEVPAEGTSYGSAAKYQPLESLKLGDYVFTFTDGGNNNAPAYYDVMSTSTSTQKTIRVYGSATTPNTMTITAPEGKSFSAIKFAGSNGKANGTVTASVGTAVMPSASELTWGADEAVTTVTFTFGQTFRINSLEITEGEGGSTPDDPTPGPGDEDNTVILSTDFDANDGFTFEDGTLPEGLTYVWTRDKNYNYMKASCFKSGNHAVEGAFLVSPVLDLTNRNEITLTFNQALGYCSAEQAAEMLSLWVREENMDWSVELPIQAWPAAVEGKNFTAFESAGVYDLDQFKNKKIQLGWKYTSTTEVGPTWEIDAVKVTGKIDNAISDIEADVNAPVEYFNLQGVRVANPENGLYIMRQGNKVTKVIR